MGSGGGGVMTVGRAGVIVVVAGSGVLLVKCVVCAGLKVAVVVVDTAGTDCSHSSL